MCEPLLLFPENNEAVNNSYVHQVKKQCFPQWHTFTLDIVGGRDLISLINGIHVVVVCLENLGLPHLIVVPNQPYCQPIGLQVQVDPSPTACFPYLLPIASHFSD